jgi:hypothetical protein
MGEYATYNGRSIKVGTCESLYGLRAEDAMKVSPTYTEPGWLYRFPWPDEDGHKPGMTEDWNRRDDVPMLDALLWLSDADTRHYSAPAADVETWGTPKRLPCPASNDGRTIPAEPYAAEVANSPVLRLVGQRQWEGKLVITVACGTCDALYRLQTIEDAQPVLDAYRAAAAALLDEEGPTDRVLFYDAVADRIEQGYTNPLAWVAENHAARAARLAKTA